MIPLPSPGALRLFPGHPPERLAAPEARGLLVGRLLEDGDGADLAWLAGALGEAEVAAWFARCGGRSLSRRSREFWSKVLGVDAPAAAQLAEELWPL